MRRFVWSIACRQHLVGHIGIGPQQFDDAVIQARATRLMGSQIIRQFGIAAKIMNIFQISLGRRHRLTGKLKSFHRRVQFFPAGG